MVEKTPEDQLFYYKRTFVHKKVAFPINKQNSKKKVAYKIINVTGNHKGTFCWLDHNFLLIKLLKISFQYKNINLEWVIVHFKTIQKKCVFEL
jgi:hypothetical protein